MIFRLALIDGIYDSGFYKAVEGYTFNDNTITMVESIYIQISGAIQSATKQAVHLPELKNLHSLTSFKDFLVPRSPIHHLHDICNHHYSSLASLL